MFFLCIFILLHFHPYIHQLTRLYLLMSMSPLKSFHIKLYQLFFVPCSQVYPWDSMGISAWIGPIFSGSNDSRSPESPKVRHPWKMENVALDCSTDRLESSSPRISEDAPSFVWKEVILCFAQQQLKQRAHYIIIYCIYLEITGSFGDFNPETSVCFQTCRGWTGPTLVTFTYSDSCLCP